MCFHRTCTTGRHCIAAKSGWSKAVVPLALKNNLFEKIESARAVVFLLDDKGKMIAQGTRWVIGGSEDKPGLAAGATSRFRAESDHLSEETRQELEASKTDAEALSNAIGQMILGIAGIRETYLPQSALKCSEKW